MNRFRRAALLVCTLVPAAACGRFGGGAVGTYPDAPIILISIDTLRSDHLPDYGYQHGSTPAISSLVSQGVLFERAYSHIPLTLPSHLTMFTGQYPGEHGVRDNLGYRFRAGDKPYLPKFLRQAGYATGGAISAFVLRPETGVSEGFDFFAGDVELRVNESIGSSQRPCGETLDKARPWLDQRGDEKFFFFFHIYEPHTPYEPPPELAAHFVSPYDGDIAAADRCVAKLTADLQRNRTWERAIVILVSDHGEGLAEHGEPEHGILLYREDLQVPFIVKLPGEALRGRRIADPVQLVDLFPTIAALAGLPTPPGLPGGPVFALPKEPRPIVAETYYPRLHLGWNELTSVIRGNWHGIFGPDPELFDTAADPGERQSVRDAERRNFAELRDLDKTLRHPLNAPMAEDAETTAKLAALGYLGSTSVVAEGPLPDPKSHVQSLGDYNRALQAVTSQNFALGLQLAQKLTVENPRMIDAWDLLGLANSRLGRMQDALTAYKRAMELTGGTPHLAISIGSVEMDMSNLEEAERYFRLALDASPAAAHTLLAGVARLREDYQAAEREAKAALAAGGSKTGPLLLLAQVYRDQGRLEEALKLTFEAQEALGSGNPKHSGLYLVRGDILGRLERVPEAIQAFQTEIERFPWDPRAYSHLAALLVASGHADEGGNVLRALIGRNPDSPSAFAEAVKSMRVLGDPRTAAQLLALAKKRFPTDQALAKL